MGESHLRTVETEVQLALDLLDKMRNKKEGELPIGEVEVAVEPQGGWANEEEDEESSEEIASIQPLSSVKPIKSMKEVKKIYELSDEQARMLKEMQKKFDQGEFEGESEPEGKYDRRK